MTFMYVSDDSNCYMVLEVLLVDELKRSNCFMKDV
jgi:hypothetical protein